MAIYNISDGDSKKIGKDKNGSSVRIRDLFFSGLMARLFFLILLVADLLWVLYAAFLVAFSVLLQLITFFKTASLREFTAFSWLKLKRSLVCGISLGVALFSPAFGIMIACTYFLTYDKAGMEEVVPSSLQSHFSLSAIAKDSS